MSFGILTPEMEEAIRPYISGHTVWDLGAGDLAYAARLQSLGAAHVTAVDKEPMTGPTGLSLYHGTFEKLASQAQAIDVAFVSWPCNYVLRGLDTILAHAKVIIYLGLNSRQEGTACGGPGLWRELIWRPLLCSVEHPRNVLLVYGTGGTEVGYSRDLHTEEKEAAEIWFPGLPAALEQLKPFRNPTTSA